MHTKSWLGNLKGRARLEGLDINGRIMDFRETGWEGVDWIHLAQDRG
jgi:hypothetical protein